MKEAVFRKEQAKLTELFKDVEESKRQLVEGLIQDAAFLLAENESLRELIGKTGMVKCHPTHPDIQKPTEAAKQYLKNVNTYSTVIKTLNSILSKNEVDEDDGLEEFE
jgi:regulator of replication initiation timing